MSWDLMSEEFVEFEWREFGDSLIGDEVIKIEHYFDYDRFPGLGYAVLSNVYANGERDVFIKSYPHKGDARIYELKVPQRLIDSNYLLHHLQVKRNLRAQVQANANWRIKSLHLEAVRVYDSREQFAELGSFSARHVAERGIPEGEQRHIEHSRSESARDVFRDGG